MKTYDDPTITYDQIDIFYDGYDWTEPTFKPISIVKKSNIDSGINKLETISSSKKEAIIEGITSLKIKSVVIKDNIISKFK